MVWVITDGLKESLALELLKINSEIEQLEKFEKEYISEQLNRNHYLIKSNYSIAKSNLLLAVVNAGGL